MGVSVMINKETSFKSCLMQDLLINDCFYVSKKKSLQTRKLLMQVVKDDVGSECKTNVSVCFKNNKEAGVLRFPNDFKVLRIDYEV